MSRYIDADVFMKNLKTNEHGDTDVNQVEIAIDKSRADVVEVVRCKECMHNGSFDTDCPFGWRDERFNLPDDMDFCSYGERKDDECR